jgi:hypothetical protein
MSIPPLPVLSAKAENIATLLSHKLPPHVAAEIGILLACNQCYLTYLSTLDDFSAG